MADRQVINGSWGEGGGQLVRMAVAFSAVTGTPIRITHIRAGRSKPGLQPQHLAAVGAVAQLCDAGVEGLDRGSSTLDFTPRPLHGGDLTIDVGTAGSVTLVLQALLPAALASRHRVTATIHGGTDVSNAPGWDYFQQVHRPLLANMGGAVVATLVRRGYYPKGGGLVRVEIPPCDGLRALQCTERGELTALRGIVHRTADLPDHISRRIATAIENKLQILPGPIVEAQTVEADSPGVGLTLWAETATTRLGACAVGAPGVPAEKVAGSAADSLVEELSAGTCFDFTMGDQILPYLALAKGESVLRVRDMGAHAETCEWLLKILVGVDFIEEEEGQTALLRCKPPAG